jgi:hypothetical protein
VPGCFIDAQKPAQWAAQKIVFGDHLPIRVIDFFWTFSGVDSGGRTILHPGRKVLKSNQFVVFAMCGRFTRMYTSGELVALYRLTVPASNLEPRYNIAPTTTIDAVISRDGKRELARMRWCLIPSWWKKITKEAPSPFTRALRR